MQIYVTMAYLVDIFEKVSNMDKSVQSRQLILWRKMIKI
jgi:hypothetical protein